MSKVTLPAVSAVKNFGKEFGEEYGDVPEVLSVDSYPDGLTSPYFDRDNDSTVLIWVLFLLALEKEQGQVIEPPNDFDIVQLLKNQQVPEPLAFDGHHAMQAPH